MLLYYIAAVVNMLSVTLLRTPVVPVKFNMLLSERYAIAHLVSNSRKNKQP